MSDILVCIRNDGCEYLTLGKEYVVLGVGNGWYDVTNDIGIVDSYDFENFTVIEDTGKPAAPIKQPFGLTPRNIYWEDLNYLRRQDIIAAMQRRMEAKMDIPVEWCKELVDLVIADNKGDIQC